MNIETTLAINVGAKLAERSKFEAKAVRLDVKGMPESTLLRMAHYGAQTILSRLFATDKDTTVSKEEYESRLAHVIDCWEAGTEWRVKSTKTGIVKPTDWLGKAVHELVKTIMKSKKIALDDVEVYAKAKAAVMSNEVIMEKCAARALVMEAEAEAKAAFDISTFIKLDF